MTAVNLSLPLRDAEMLIHALEVVAADSIGGEVECECGEFVDIEGVHDDDFPAEEVAHLIATLRLSVEAAR